MCWLLSPGPAHATPVVPLQEMHHSCQRPPLAQAAAGSGSTGCVVVAEHQFVRGDVYRHVESEIEQINKSSYARLDSQKFGEGSSINTEQARMKDGAYPW